MKLSRAFATQSIQQSITGFVHVGTTTPVRHRTNEFSNCDWDWVKGYILTHPFFNWE